MKKKFVYQLGVFQQLDLIYPIEASSDDEAREILLEKFKNGEAYLIDHPDAEVHVERVKIKEEGDWQ